LSPFRSNKIPRGNYRFWTETRTKFVEVPVMPFTLGVKDMDVDPVFAW